MVERNLAKVEVAGPSPVFRSKLNDCLSGGHLLFMEHKRKNLNSLIIKNSDIISAERTRFELVVRNDPYVGLANRWFQPLTHLSKPERNANIVKFIEYLAICDRTFVFFNGINVFFPCCFDGISVVLHH